jgi:hypothetical protein
MFTRDNTRNVLDRICVQVSFATVLSDLPWAKGEAKRPGQAHVLGKRALEVGPATVERATIGRYDWQDGGLRKRRREDETREEGERRLRPRDLGKKGRHQ